MYRFRFLITAVLLILFITSDCHRKKIFNGLTFSYKFDHSIHIESVEDALAWCADNIIYKTDRESTGVIDYWQSPEQTYKLRTGDCEDFCFLLMYLMKEKLNLSPKFVIVQKIDNNECHAVVELGDKWYESTGGFEANKNHYRLKATYEYIDALWTTTVNHIGVF